MHVCVRVRVCEVCVCVCVFVYVRYACMDVNHQIYF